MITKYNDFLNESIREDIEKERAKEEKRYLSKKEIERLTTAQKRAVVKRRKELGSMNDADLKESLRDKMTPKTEEEIIEVLEKNPTTMLYYGCKHGNLDYVKRAIKNGADTRKTFHDEEPSEDYYQDFSALDIAIKNKQYKIIEYLLNLGGYKRMDFYILDNFIMEMVGKKDRKILDILVKNVGDDRERLVVEAIIKSGDLELLKYIIEKHKLDINHAKGIYLREAGNAKSVDIVKYLLDSGIMIGVHAMMTLKIAVHNYNKDIIDVLISHGIKPDKETLEYARGISMKLYFRLLKNKLKRK